MEDGGHVLVLDHPWDGVPASRHGYSPHFKRGAPQTALREGRAGCRVLGVHAAGLSCVISCGCGGLAGWSPQRSLLVPHSGGPKAETSPMNLWAGKRLRKTAAQGGTK